MSEARIDELLAQITKAAQDSQDYEQANWPDIDGWQEAIRPILRSLTEENERAARILFMFQDAAGPVSPHDGFARIESPEPWRAAGRFFDDVYGGTAAARKALSPIDPPLAQGDE